jgi:redox-sensitive bicupin YhaK (pirin superfamily)
MTVIAPRFVADAPFQHFSANAFPVIHPVHWMNAHFAVGGPSPLQRLSGMLTAHMTRIAPHNGFTWHPHRGVEIFTWILEGTLHHEDSTGGMGDIRAGELQRMFSGTYIEHQELNLTDDPVRVIQIWFVADLHYRAVAPHYQQLSSSQLPSRRIGDATVTALIGDDSPMERHMLGQPRLTATTIPSGGSTTLELPRAGEDLFLYITDGGGDAAYPRHNGALGQYDVLLIKPGAEKTALSAGAGAPLRYLSFYLPSFLPEAEKAHA